MTKAAGRRAKAPGPSAPGPADTAGRWRNRIVGYEEVDPRTLKPHEQNWRTHPGEQRTAMAGILDDVGVADAIKVSKRTGRILDGHLRHDLAIREGERTVPVLWLDVSEAEERKILATHDAIAGLAGIDRDNLDSLLADIQTDNAGMMALLDGLAGPLDDEEGGAGLAVDDGQEFDDIADELDGAHTLKPDMVFPSNLKWGIPPLREDRLAGIPDSIVTWAGPDVSTDDGKSTYFWTWRSDSTRGMPVTRTIVGFYTNDERFDGFYLQPDRYTAKLLNFGTRVALAPNYSHWGNEPKALHLYATYRSRYVGRYLQEAGIRVIPDVAWSSLEELEEFGLIGIPRNAPAIATQLQTQDMKTNSAARAMKREGIELIRDTLAPAAWLVYGGPDGEALVKSIDFGAPVTFVLNRTAVRRPTMEKGKQDAGRSRVRRRG